ncbi:MAG: hypothetical protein AAF614_14565 [Chloroflexota bacterium]
MPNKNNEKLKFIGPKFGNDGKMLQFGEMEQSDILQMLTARLGNAGLTATFKQHLNSCITEMISGAKQATGIYKFKGLPIYHVSNGRGKNADGCTLFYVHQKNPGNDFTTGVVVGIGHHTQLASSNSTYELEWIRKGWNEKVKVGTKIRL